MNSIYKLFWILGYRQQLAEIKDDQELKAKFKELASQFSDCSSAKRGGDLGFFEPRTMQPKFSQAALALKPYELSDIVSTDSGVHIILRLAWWISLTYFKFISGGFPIVHGFPFLSLVFGFIKFCEILYPKPGHNSSIHGLAPVKDIRRGESNPFYVSKGESRY